MDDQIFDKVKNVDLKKTMENSYIDYAMSVIASRALPDVRDGLKPVQRRVLYSMIELNNGPDKPHRKSARIVGDTMGKYHPHGDSSIYGALVNMAQDWSFRYPLVDGHGNFGSVDGDGAAAMRYTEARLSKISMELLADIGKDTVDFVPNFDEKRREPLVLPTRIPTLLINGSSGIAVGMATYIPPHNLTEVLDGAIAQIDDPEISVEDLMEYIKGPDFPTKASIMGKSGIRAAYATGKGRIIVRAKTQIEEHKDGSYSIIVTELPYQVNKKMLVESIASLVKDKKIEGLSDIDDHSSDRVGIRLEIFLKRDANPQVVLNQLFKYTKLQDSLSINMLAIKDGRPKTMGLKEILDQYIIFQKKIVTRRTQYDLSKAEARMHILEGLRIALNNIDEIINIIRNSYDDAKERLMETFGLSDIQAQSVLDMRLGQLQKLNGEKIEEEYAELSKKVEEYKKLLSDETVLLEQIKKEIIEIRDKYGDERLTTIEPAIDIIEDEDLIEREECVLTMTHFGYIKRLPLDTYKNQHRGGRGVSGLSTREEDFVEKIFTASSHDFILFLTNTGRMFKTKVYRIPEAGRTAKGTAVVNLIGLEKDEKVTAMIPIKEFSNEKYLTMITRQGFVKKTNLSEYDTNRKGGLIAISLREGDELMSVDLTDGESNIILCTKNGMCIKFKETDVRPMGRSASGVTGIRLSEGDYVIGGSVCDIEGAKLLTVTENGYGKKTDINEFKCQNRAGRGVTGYKITEKTGLVAGIAVIAETDDLMVITSDGIIIRMSTDEISEFGRVTQGVKVMRTSDDVKVVSIAKAEKEEETQEEIKEDVQKESTPQSAEE